jgi:hypothetical protein
VAVQTCHVVVQTCNVAVQTCHVVVQTCNVVVQTRNVAVQTCNVVVQSCNVVFQTCNVVVQSCNNLGIIDTKMEGALRWEILTLMALFYDWVVNNHHSCPHVVYKSQGKRIKMVVLFA